MLFFPSILLNSTLLEWMVGKRWVKGEEGEYYVVVRAIKKLSIRVHFKSSYIRGVLGCIGRTFRTVSDKDDPDKKRCHRCDGKKSTRLLV